MMTDRTSSALTFSRLHQFVGLLLSDVDRSHDVDSVDASRLPKRWISTRVMDEVATVLISKMCNTIDLYSLRTF